jgi:RNA polymerase sigma-70 factor (ECF subfamily)
VADTPISLLERLRLGSGAAAWERFVALYGPLIRAWLGRHGLQPSDVDDLAQEVLQVLLRELPHFHHNLRRGAFRRWLRAIVVNRLRTFWRERRALPQPGGADIGPLLDQLEDADTDLSRAWDEEHDRHVARRLLELIEPDFEPATWRAFRLLVLEARPTAEVADTVGISANAVRIAKSRVLARLREEIAGLID